MTPDTHRKKVVLKSQEVCHNSVVTCHKCTQDCRKKLVTLECRHKRVFTRKFSQGGCHEKLSPTRSFTKPISGMLSANGGGGVVQSAASQLLEQVDALLRRLPQVQPMSGQALEESCLLSPDDYTTTR